MGLSTLEQLEVDQSATYNEALDPSGVHDSQTTMEGDLNVLRSQMRKVLYGTPGGSEHWYDGPVNSIYDLDARATLEGKTVIYRIQILSGISVDSGKNYVVLSATGSETPSENISHDGSAEGAVCVELQCLALTVLQ